MTRRPVSRPPAPNKPAPPNWSYHIARNGHRYVVKFGRTILAYADTLDEAYDKKIDVVARGVRVPVKG